ncbi:MAG: hypothetical protein J5556_04330 [Deltaproteobacteria bacterium]|nr:hypothetical protein [Deltaproteobacteria bacterium]
MGGTTIDNWKSFEKNMFQDLNNPEAVKGKEAGILAGKVDSVKTSYTAEPSALKYVLKSIFSLGIYSLVSYLKGKNQAQTLEAVKAGVDNVHSAMSFIAAKRAEAFTSEAFIKATQITVLKDGEKIPKGLELRQGDANDDTFADTKFLRAKMGGCNVDFSVGNGPNCTIRISNGKGSAEVVHVLDLEEALFNLEKNIARQSDVFGTQAVEKMISRYDTRLDENRALNAAGRYTGGGVGLLRKNLKEHQLAICRELLESRCGLPAEKLKYLDRGLARDLALQVSRDNITSNEAVLEHYNKIISQHHITDQDAVALNDKLEAFEATGAQLPVTFLEEPVQPDDVEAGRPDAGQKPLHDFVGDLILGENAGDYDKDIGRTGRLDGRRMRNIFEAHKDVLSGILAERAANPGAEPAALGSLHEEVKGAVLSLLDAILKQHGEAVAGNDFASEQAEGSKGWYGDFIARLTNDFDKSRDVDVDDLPQRIQHEKFGIGGEKGRADFKADYEYTQANMDKLMDLKDPRFMDELDYNMAVEDDKKFDPLRQGKANFFARLEFELDQKIAESMRTSIQAKINGMINGQFPEAKKIDTTGSLDDILNDRGSDPQMQLLKKTLEIYFGRMSPMDQRRMLAGMVRHTTGTADDGMQFGEILKGAGPVLQKMLQGLDPESFTNAHFRAAIRDMQSNLSHLPKQFVKANLLNIIQQPGGNIESINVLKSIGAATVGETFLCSVKFKGALEERNCVIKMLRPDAHLRALREADIFREVARTVPGMGNTFETRLAGIMDELDLSKEARNVEKGLNVYDSGTGLVNKTFKNVNSMRLFAGIPSTKNCMVLEKAPGLSMDKFMEHTKGEIAGLADAALEVFKTCSQDQKNEVMLNAAEDLTDIYEDAFEKQDALGNLATIWIREGLFTKTGFYHGDLHAGNIMVPERNELPQNAEGRRTGNQVTMIDFGNATTLSTEEQKNVVRVIAGAAGNDPALFLKGLAPMLSEAGQAAFKANEAAVRQTVSEIFAKGTGNDAGKRMSAAFKLLQATFNIEVPGAINNFQASQERLGVAMENMLRTMTTAEMRRLDVILAQAESEGFETQKPAPGALLGQVFAMKYADAMSFLQGKIDNPATPENERVRFAALKEKLSAAEGHRPASMMSCMVNVIKQNIWATIKALGSSAKTVRTHLTQDGIIADGQGNAQEAGEKERRFDNVIWP